MSDFRIDLTRRRVPVQREAEFEASPFTQHALDAALLVPAPKPAPTGEPVKERGRRRKPGDWDGPRLLNRLRDAKRVAWPAIPAPDGET